MRDRFVGVWLLERPDGALVLTSDGWFSLLVAGDGASAGHYGVEGDRFLLDPTVALEPADVGRVREWRWTFDGDCLELIPIDGAPKLRWHREDRDVVASLGPD